LPELIAAGAGLLQCALIWGGLRQMQRASDVRDRQMDARDRKLDAQLEALFGAHRAYGRQRDDLRAGLT
jgi:hypothetical protein